MRPLTDEEFEVFFRKLQKYIGENIKYLLDSERSGGQHVFRIVRNKVYYLSAALLKQCSIFSKDQLLHTGTLLGQFSKKKKFRLAVTSLGVLAKYATTKVWLKTSGEQNYLYGNHALKAHVARVSDNGTKHGGVIVMSLSDVPLGFGVLCKGALEFKMTDPTAILVINQADLGEYLRVEGDVIKSKGDDKN